LICPSPPPNSVESPKIFESTHYLTVGKEHSAFNILNYKNNSEQRIRATYHAIVGTECVEYKTDILEPGQKVGGNNTILFYKLINQGGGNGKVKIFVEVLE
jgi:hypothetical protein